MPLKPLKMVSNQLIRSINYFFDLDLIKFDHGLIINLVLKPLTDNFLYLVTDSVFKTLQFIVL